jgi:hypothetical protein
MGQAINAIYNEVMDRSGAASTYSQPEMRMSHCGNLCEVYNRQQLQYPRSL